MSTCRPHHSLDPTIPVLEFQRAGLALRAGDESPSQLGLAVGTGELALVQVAVHADSGRLADAAQGLRKPGTGRVRYRGTDWTRLNARAAERRRGEIGRVFGANAWINNLDVEENVMLRLRHHRTMSHRQLEAHIREAAAAFGVDALSHLRPGDMPRRELQVAQWIRAFAGSPPLVLLEHPVNADGVPVPLLLQAVASLRARGGAVVWMTGREDIWTHPGLDPQHRYRIKDRRIIAGTEEA